MQITASIPTPFSTRSLVELVPGCGPRRDADQAYDAVHDLAGDLSSGRAYLEDFNKRLPTLARDIDSACQSSKAPTSSRDILAQLGAAEVSTEAAAGALERSGGLVTTGRASVAINKEHRFDMSYTPSGAFTGSRSYERDGSTSVFSVEVLQKPGAGPDDAAAVRIQYRYPAYFSFDTSGTSLDGKSGSDALYFVPRRSDVSGLETLLADRERVDTQQPVGTMLSDLVNSLDRLSPVSLQNDTRGFGRVGTSYDNHVRMPVGFNPKREARGMVAALVTERAATDVLGIATAPAPAVKPSGHAVGAAIGMGLLGAAAAGIGCMAHATLGPVGLAMSAGLAVLSGAGFAAAVNGEVLKANGATDQQVTVQRVKAFALGLVLGGAAGATLAIPGTPLAAGVAAASWAAAGAAAGATCR